MNHFFVRCTYPWIIPVLGVVILVAMLLRKKIHKPVIYHYSLGHAFKKRNDGYKHPYKKILYILRLCVLVALALVIAKPQIVDSRSKVPVKGVDIVLVLDVSGSMDCRDYEDDERSRFDVAKAEAIRFIEKRHHDALGLVLFGKDTISRCPITFDKELLKTVVEELKLGVIDYDGTMLINGMITAANRLKHSQAKSKIMIVLTDGEPSEGDSNESIIIDIAKKLGIKIYTIGIGNEKERYGYNMFGVPVVMPKVNKQLLTHIARQTDGQYFFAHNARDMRRIYDTIDRLEKTEHEEPIFSVYYDLLFPCVALVMVLLFSELLLSTFVWFAL